MAAAVGRELDVFISIHAPHEGERRLTSTAPKISRKVFQSTLPTRGSDVIKLRYVEYGVAFQSTLPTRGSDLAVDRRYKGADGFQSTLPTRGSDLVTAIL